MTASRVAVVTGGSGDIGRAIATALAFRMTVVITARHAGPLERAARAIGAATGRPVHVCPSDALEQRSVDTLVADTIARFGRIDVLANCAASTSSLAGGVEALDVDALMADMNTKVGGYLRYIRAVVPVMKRQKAGQIVNIGGLTGRATETLSGMRNVAVSHLTKVLSDQLGPDGITVNAVHPGIVATPHLDDVFQERARTRDTDVATVAAEFVADIPMRRFLSVDEIAEVVAILATPSMTGITGQSITVDAGYSRGVYL
ncbi:SDR family oxidoreductase [Sphingomonadaceae bacterium jetA1]|jgi:NAD(P)-dependent dehydrogenase (short-subunit alcohol dehydrogenase family)|uniref:SDR family NAD(P)-dependent oxidoreductase n=1 Tax=Facivitalis istanbulensis TaxID=3075838 RepID=UPI0034953C31